MYMNVKRRSDTVWRLHETFKTKKSHYYWGRRFFIEKVFVFGPLTLRAFGQSKVAKT